MGNEGLEGRELLQGFFSNIVVLKDSKHSRAATRQTGKSRPGV